MADGRTYLGGGHLIGVPAADLTPEDVEALGARMAEVDASGLYRKGGEPPKPKPEPAAVEAPPKKG